MALFQTFSTWHRILSALTALYWPSTAFYWPSTTKYQPVPPYTDPVPSWINHYRLILIQCHQVPTSRATYWPSTFKYHVLFCDLLALQTSPGYTPAWKGGCYLKGNSRHCSFWWFYWMIIGNFGDCHEPQYQGIRPRQQSCRWDTWGSSSRGLLARCTTTTGTLLCINVSFIISIIFLYFVHFFVFFYYV